MDASRTVETAVEQHLSLRIGDGEYAVPLLRVREILQLDPPIAVPGAPPWIRGITNIRGDAVPVIDLAAKLGSRSPASKRPCLVVIDTVGEAGRFTFGLAADGVNGVVDLAPADVQPPPQLGGGVRLRILAGVGKVGQRLVLLLALDEVLSADEAALATGLASAGGEAKAPAA